jgi:uncharacterized protein YndB with AHSA1/START domain
MSIVIARPAEVVFAYISNYEHDSQWRAGIIEMTKTPPGRTQIGTKTREVARFFGKKRVTPAEITNYEPDRKVAFAGLMANSVPVSGSRTVERVEEQTRFIYQAKVELRGSYSANGAVDGCDFAKTLHARFAAIERAAGDCCRAVELRTEPSPARECSARLNGVKHRESRLVRTRLHTGAQTGRGQSYP